MPSVTIDTGALVAPPLSASPEDVHQYIQSILDWRRLLDEDWVKIYMSERAPEILFEDGLYPFRESLKQLFTSKGIIQYDVNTVARVTDHLLQITPTFEKFFRVSDVLASELTTNPDLLSFSITKNLASDLARCIVLIAILRGHCLNTALDHTLIMRYAPDAQSIEVRALIHEFEHLRDDMEPIPMDPEYFEGTVLVCNSFRSLVLSIDETAIWDAAQDEVGIDLAVRIALYKSRIDRQLEPEWDNLGLFVLGRRFFETAKACCRVNPGSFPRRVLRAMLETIEGSRMEDTHALREDIGGNVPQRTRGEDKAWRRDIDYEYHLHYWGCEDGTKEFASVVSHNDFSIPG